MDITTAFSPWVNLGGWLVVVALVVVSIVRGLLIPASQVERIIALYETLLADKDKQIANLREAYNNSDARGDILAENQRNLLESVKITNELIQALSHKPSEKKENA